MNRDSVDFQQANEIDSEVFGEPGHRTFRIRIRKESDTASLWIEKQQLQALCIAMRQILEEYRMPDPTILPRLPMPTFPEQVTIDFKIARLSLSWDENNQHFAISTEPQQATGSEPSSFRCEVDIPQAVAFCNLAEEIVASGRPICPLCLEPMEPSGHTCIRTNGHFKGRPIPDISEEDDED
jgi:uncharacterized repeat protein (TIGR03847 family)